MKRNGGGVGVETSIEGSKPRFTALTVMVALVVVAVVAGPTPRQDGRLSKFPRLVVDEMKNRKKRKRKEREPCNSAKPSEKKKNKQRI